jgi:signal peptidase II
VTVEPAAPPASVEPAHAPLRASAPPEQAEAQPTFLFFGIVAAVSLVLDVGSKAWAEIVLSKRPFDSPSIIVVPDHLTFTIAYNKGGAWGLLQDASETVRRPFFFAVSVLAVLFIVSLYSKLGRGQRALTWGLPLVLGGALGNLSDRVTRSSVIDFIDYRAEWVLTMNTYIGRLVPRWGLTDHWPTFNVADIAICIGVGLMAVDMFTSRRGPERRSEPVSPPVLGA